MKNQRLAIGAALALATGLCGGAQAQLIESHTYQGRLNSGGAAADGVHQVRLRVFNAAAGGALLAEQIRQKTFVSADSGLFTFDDLDFGNVFDTGADRWIEMSVRQGTSGVWTVLGPRQPVTAAPTADVANQLALPYMDTALEPFESVLDIQNSSTEFAGSHAGRFTQGALPGSAWNAAGLIAESDEWFGLIGAGGPGTGGVTGVGVIDGSFGVRGDRSPGNVLGVAGFFNDGENGTTTYIGRGSYAAQFFGSTLFSGSMDISGEEIDSTEISNEPGVAGSIPGGFFNVGTVTINVASRTITVPAAGYVLAMANCDIQMNHTSGGGSSFVNVAVSDTSASMPSEQDQLFRVPSAAPTGFYNTPGSAHGVFSVNAGANTLYMVANGSASGTNQLFDTNFTLIYLPTAYGVVNSTMPPAPGDPLPWSQDTATGQRTGLSHAEIEAEYHAELARHMAEMDAKQREMEALLVEVEALRARVKPTAMKED